MGRAPCCDKANVKKGPWSPEEDATLKAYIEVNGTGGNWIALPQKIGLKRCGKSCRLRWLNYLRPNIKHGGFTEEEENIICNLYIAIGSRWSIIAAQLPGRTDNDIKNYWNTRLKKKLMAKQRKEQQAACRLLEQEMKIETENFLVNQTLNQATYWVDQQTSMPMMIPYNEAHHFGYQDQLTRLLMKDTAQLYDEDQLNSNNYQYPTQDQFNVGQSAIQASNIDYTNVSMGYDVNGATMNIMHQGHEIFPPELDEYLNNQLSIEGVNESNSGVDAGSSSDTSNSTGNSSWDDIN